MRKLSVSELPEIEAIARQCFEETKQPDESFDFEHFCWAANGALENGSMVLWASGEPIEAYLLANFVPGLFGGTMSAYSVSWFVKPEHRKSGVGSALFNEFMAEAGRRNCRRHYFGHPFTVNQDGNKSFFEKRGFRHVENLYRKDV